MLKTKIKISKASIYQFKSFFHLNFLNEGITSTYIVKVKLSKISHILDNSSLKSLEIVHYNSAPSIVPVKFYDKDIKAKYLDCLLYTSPSPRDLSTSRMPSSA